MDRIPLTPPIIRPLPENISSPLWSVMIPAYNCSEYLKRTLTSVLFQDPGEHLMQIEVVDDCSTDADVEQIVKQIGKGRVLYFRQPVNVGSLRNFETCINRARGHYIHLLHGDDCVRNGFYKTMAELFERFPDAGAAFCAYNMVREDDSLMGPSEKEADEPCILQNWLYKIAVESRLQYVCMVVKRQVYESVGSFYMASYGEDWEMWTRIAKKFPTAYTPEILAEYRVHHNSITGNSFLNGANVRDISKVINTISSHFPVSEQPYINRQSRKYYAYDALKKTHALWYRTGNRKAVKIQVKEIFRLYSDVYLAIKSLKIRMLLLLPHSFLTKLRGKLQPDLYLPYALTGANNGHIDICLAFDKSYFTPFFVLLTSIFLNNSCRFTFHVIANGLSAEEINDIVRFVEKNNSTIKFYHTPKTNEVFVIPENSYFSIVTYYRIFFPELVPAEIKKIIYLDIDIVVIGDLYRLYSLEPATPIAAVTDPKEGARPELGIYTKGKYFNSGVLLINIQEWKKQDVSGRTIKYLTDFPEKIKWVDQDALNAILKDNWEPLPKEFNITFYDVPKYLKRQEMKNFLRNKIVIHYTTQNKPWIENSTNRLRYLYYYFLDRSPHANAIDYWPKMNSRFWLRRIKRRIKEFLIDYTKVFSE